MGLPSKSSLPKKQSRWCPLSVRIPPAGAGSESVSRLPGSASLFRRATDPHALRLAEKDGGPLGVATPVRSPRKPRDRHAIRVATHVDLSGQRPVNGVGSLCRSTSVAKHVRAPTKTRRPRPAHLVQVNRHGITIGGGPGGVGSGGCPPYQMRFGFAGLTGVPRAFCPCWPRAEVDAATSGCQRSFWQEAAPHLYFRPFFRRLLTSASPHVFRRNRCPPQTLRHRSRQPFRPCPARPSDSFHHQRSVAIRRLAQKFHWKNPCRVHTRWRR